MMEKFTFIDYNQFSSFMQNKDFQANNIVFWTGAGIDCDTPTCLPLGAALTEKILSWTCGDMGAELFKKWGEICKAVNSLCWPKEKLHLSSIPRLESILERVRLCEKQSSIDGSNNSVMTMIREINEWIKHLEDLPLGSIKSSGKNRPFILQPWRDNYKTALRKCRDMQEEYEVAEVVLSTMRTVKAAKLYAEIPFILQNVEGCLRDADIFINNETDNERLILLKKKLLRYVSLIMNPGLVLPTPIERGMQIAYTAKLNSGCISRQVGAAITDDQYHLLSVGWNQQPEMQLPCLYRDLCSLYYQWAPDAYSDFELDNQNTLQKNIQDPVTKLLSLPECPLKLQGKMPAYCFKDLYNSITGVKNQVHPRSLHAEETAFLNLGQHSAKGGNLFTTSSPCELCAKKAMYMGIKKVYYIEPYAGLSFNHVLSIGPREARPEMLLFTGAVGRAYTQLYTPLMPQKDELTFWMGANLDANLLKNIQKNIVKNTPAPTENSPETTTDASTTFDEGGGEDDTSPRFPSA